MGWRSWTIAIGLGAGLVMAASPVDARKGSAAALGRALAGELGLTQQAVALERSMATLVRHQAGSEHSATLLEHAAGESLRLHAAYKEGHDIRQSRARTRARAMYKAARGGIARLAFEDVAEQAPTGAQRVTKGRDLRWLVRHDLRELGSYERSERRARDELLSAHRQLQALSALHTVQTVEAELLATARQATNPALLRAHKQTRQKLATTPQRVRSRKEHRAMLRQLREAQAVLKKLQRDGERLRRPVRGRVVGPFGEYEDRVLRVPMIRNGVELAARRDERVRAPAAGRVAMVASLPGFEQVVVLDHEDGRMTMLGRLWKTHVGEDDRVQAGEPIAFVAPKATDDGLGTTLYLELRHGDMPVDPAPLLRRR